LFCKYDFFGVDEEGKPERKQRWKLLAGVQTKKQALQELARVERDVAAGQDPFPKRLVPAAVKALLESWAGGLTNRNAPSDRTLVRKHLVPRFGRLSIEEITVAVIKEWLRDLAASSLSPQTQRHALGTLSRFFGWLIEEERTTLNPVKMIPLSKRPVVVHKPRAWLETPEQEAKLPDLIAALPAPVDLMFALSNRSGMRLGEVCGLRMSDLDDLPRGFIRVSHSYGGPLKEDKRGVGKVKKVPAPIDAEEVLKLHLARRRLNGAKADDLVFVPTKPSRRPRTKGWEGFRKEHINHLWRAACKACGLVDAEDNPTVTFYGATRTTAASRAARADVPIEQISTSLGHSSSDLTQKHYVQHVREDFALALRLPMMPAPTSKR
jgi:integrase